MRKSGNGEGVLFSRMVCERRAAVTACGTRSQDFSPTAKADKRGKSPLQRAQEKPTPYISIPMDAKEGEDQEVQERWVG